MNVMIDMCSAHVAVAIASRNAGQVQIIDSRQRCLPFRWYQRRRLFGQPPLQPTLGRARRRAATLPNRCSLRRLLARRASSGSSAATRLPRHGSAAGTPQGARRACARARPSRRAPGGGRAGGGVARGAWDAGGAHARRNQRGEDDRGRAGRR
jgi:hypothetical protein